MNELEKQAETIVNSLSNDPEGRYQLRFKFYEKYGFPTSGKGVGYGKSELAFMKWEISSGRLNALDNPTNPGSPWWRLVNSRFLFIATYAGLIYESKENIPDLPKPVQAWLDYINQPNEQTWYVAHNSTIVDGYITQIAATKLENQYEQCFMNIVLYRLLYAQSMVEGVSFGWLGKILGNPSGDAVSIITDIDSFYPDHYPLSKEEIKYVMHKAHNLEGLVEDFFDELFILPELDKIYQEASQWDHTPSLSKFTKDNKPMYPNID